MWPVTMYSLTEHHRRVLIKLLNALEISAKCTPEKEIATCGRVASKWTFRFYFGN